MKVAQADLWYIYEWQRRPAMTFLPLVDCKHAKTDSEWMCEYAHVFWNKHLCMHVE